MQIAELTQPLMLSDQRRVRLVVTPHPFVIQSQISIDVDLSFDPILKNILMKYGIGESWLVELSGMRVPFDMWSRIRLKQGQIIECRPLVQDKNTLRGVAFLVLAWYTLGYGNGPLLAATGTTAGTFSAYAVGAAAFFVGATLINRVLPIPTPGMMQLSTNKVAPTYSLSGGQNSMRLWEPMAIVWGQPYCVPDLASQPYTYFKGGKQILVQTFHAGLNCQSIDTLRIGQTSLSSYKDVSLYAKGFPVPPSNSSPNLPANNVDSIPGALLDFSGADTVSVTRTTSPNTVRIEVDLELSLFTVNQSTGKYETKGVGIEAIYSRAGRGEWYAFPETNWPITGTAFEVFNNTTEPLRITLSVNVAPGQYDVRMTKMTKNTLLSNEQNSVTWSQLKSYQPDLTNYPGQSLLAVWIQASGQLNGALVDFNWVATARPAPIWNGAGWVTATNRGNGLSNPGVQILQYARGIYDENNQLIAGLGWPDSRIDIEGLKKFMLWCTANNFTFDAIIQQAMSHDDMLNVIAYAGMGSIGWPDGRLSVLFLDSAAPVEGVINMANIKAKSFSVNYAVSDRADEIEYGYFDRANNNSWNSLRVLAPGVTMPTGTARLSNIGITSEAHAAILARYSMAQNVYMTKSITFEQDMEFLTYRKGTVLALSHDLTQWGYGGRIDTAQNFGGFLTLMLDDLIPATGPNGEVSRVIGLRLQGETQYRIFNVKPFTGSVRQVTLATPWPDGVTSPNGHEALWIYDFKPTPGLKVLVTGIEPSDNQEGAKVTVTPLPDEFWTYVRTGAYTASPNRSLLTRLPKVTAAKVTEMLKRQGNSYATDLTVSFDVTGPCAQTEVWAGTTPTQLSMLGKTPSQSFTWSGVLDQTWTIELRPYNDFGQLGGILKITYVVIGLAFPPSDVTGLTVKIENNGIRMTWDACPDIDYKETVIKIGNSWAVGSEILRKSSTSHLLDFRRAGLFNFLAKHIDTVGKESNTAAISSFEVTAPSAPVNLRLLALNSSLQASWQEPVPRLTDQPINRVELSWDNFVTIIDAKKATSAVFDWRGISTHTLSARYVDIAGNVGSTSTVGFSVRAPSRVTVTRANIQENEVSLGWSDAKTDQPIKSYAFYTSLVTESFSAALLYGKAGADSRSDVIKFFSSGQKRIWLVAEDVAGNLSEPTFIDVSVSLPGNFALITSWDFSFTGQGVNTYLSNGVLYLPFNTTETWGQHFSSNGWQSPQNQVDAGFPFYAQPTALSGSYSEVRDLGKIIPSVTIKVVIQSAIVAGNPVSSTLIEWSSDNVSFSAAPVGATDAQAKNVRYVRVSYKVDSADRKGILSLQRVNVTIGGEEKTEFAELFIRAADVNGTKYVTTKGFFDVVGVQVTPRSSALGVSSGFGRTPEAYWTDTNAPTVPAEVYVVGYNASGQRTDGYVSLQINGT